MDLETAFVQIDSSAPSFQTHYEIFKFMKALTEGLDLTAFLVLSLPTCDVTDIRATKIITNWPTELIDFYDQNHLLLDSPIILRMMHSTVPLDLNLDNAKERNSEDRKLRAIDAFLKHRMGRGTYFPVHDAVGSRGAVSFNGTRSLSRDEKAKLLYISTHIYDRLSQITHVERNNSVELSKTELECLQLAAGGKTGGEIARLLNITETNAYNHIAAAVKKLGCENRTQAIISAMRLNLIRA